MDLEQQLQHLRSLDNESLLRSLKRHVGSSNRLNALVLAHLAEVEARRAYREWACDTLAAYCVYELRLSEDEAQRRCRAARVVRQFPVLLGMLADASIHLTGILLLAPYLTEENHREVLARARYRRKREIERLVAELAPAREVPAIVEPIRPAVQRFAPARSTWARIVDGHEGWVRHLKSGDGRTHAPSAPNDWHEALVHGLEDTQSDRPCPDPSVDESDAGARIAPAESDAPPRKGHASNTDAPAREGDTSIADPPAHSSDAPARIAPAASDAPAPEGFGVDAPARLVSRDEDQAPAGERRTAWRTPGDGQPPMTSQETGETRARKTCGATGDMASSQEGNGTAREGASEPSAAARSSNSEPDAVALTVSRESLVAPRCSGVAPALRYKVQFTADQAYVDLLERARDLLWHQVPNADLVQLQRLALEALVEKLLRRKCGGALPSDQARPRASGAPRSRESERTPGASATSASGRTEAGSTHDDAPGQSSTGDPAPTQAPTVEDSQAPIEDAHAPIEDVHAPIEDAQPPIEDVQRPTEGVQASTDQPSAPARVLTENPRVSIEQVHLSTDHALAPARQLGSTAPARTNMGSARTSSAPAAPSELSRYIPASIRRQVWERDGGRCTFSDPRGVRCRATRAIEFHHEHPYALGGAHHPENMTLRCRSHNELAAERDFGRDLMLAMKHAKRPP